MTPSFVYAPPSNMSCLAKPSGNPTSESRNLGLKAKVRFNELSDLAVLFRELLLLARTYSSGRCSSEADRFSLSLTHIN
jgi:hypothetical protein